MAEDEGAGAPSTKKTSTAISHIILAGTGIYCWKCFGFNVFTYPHGCYTIITINSILGTLFCVLGDNEQIKNAYEYGTIIETLVILPCITTTIWLKYNMMWELSIGHTVAAIIPVILYFINNKNKEKVAQAVVGINCLSCGIVSAMNENWFGLGAAIMYGLNYFYLRKDGLKNIDLPPRDIYNYGVCIFGILALKAIRDAWS